VCLKILMPRHLTFPLTLLSPPGDKRNCYHHNLLSVFHGLSPSYIWLHISNYLNHKEVIHFRNELHLYNFLVFSLYKISNSLPVIKKVIHNHIFAHHSFWYPQNNLTHTENFKPQLKKSLKIGLNFCDKKFIQIFL
jgi:hypothetical protein